MSEIRLHKNNIYCLWTMSMGFRISLYKYICLVSSSSLWLQKVELIVVIKTNRSYNVREKREDKEGLPSKQINTTIRRGPCSFYRWL